MRKKSNLRTNFELFEVKKKSSPQRGKREFFKPSPLGEGRVRGIWKKDGFGQDRQDFSSFAANGELARKRTLSFRTLHTRV